MRSYGLALILFLFSLTAYSQKKYQGLLWKISGNGLEKPSYLYGTMHVSNRVAFHLSETFFEALDQADVVALETNPEFWIQDIARSQLMQDYFRMSMMNNRSSYPLYTSFVPKQPLQSELEYYLAQDQDMLNNMLWRFSANGENFEEGTFLDLFIYQSGKKKGKKVVALEDFEDSFRSVLLSNRFDKDAKPLSERQALKLLGDFQSWEELQEDAYRKGDLDLLDTIVSSLYTSRYYRENMLNIRNEIMAHGMDSLMQLGTLFTGVGAAHLPGNMGVINLLRQRGYTVTPEERVITSKSIDEKEKTDALIFEHQLQDFRSDDGFIQTRVPGPMSKLVSGNYQEYLFADMANGAYYSLRRINTAAPFYGKDAGFYAAKVDSLLFENIPGKIVSNTPITVSGYPGIDILNTTKQGDWQHYRIIFTPLEILIFKAGGVKEFVKSAQASAFFEQLSLGTARDTSVVFQPAYGGFKVSLPLLHRSERYRSIYYNPYETYWAEAMDEESNHFAVAHRQYHDFSYIEEDDFELKYLIENLEEDELFEVDTLYLLDRYKHPASAFRFHSPKGTTYYGELHIQGPHYIALFTSHPSESERQKFFRSFQFRPLRYSADFTERTDTNLHYSMLSPMPINNNLSFLQMLGVREELKQTDFEEKIDNRILTCEQTGEQLKVSVQRIHRLASYESPEEFWKEHDPLAYFINPFFSEATARKDLILIKDSLLFSEVRDTSYFTEGREQWYTDTNSTRALRVKTIIENGALYTLIGLTDTLGYSSLFLDQAFASFRPSPDTVLGHSILHRQAGRFFANLYSHDSSLVYESSTSIGKVTFKESDAQGIQAIIDHYTDPVFDRENRLEMISTLAESGGEDNIDYLARLYERYTDSSAYQFAILETLIAFEDRDALKTFKKLLLNETPFSNNSYTSNSLIRKLEDSVELARPLFPELLELADFEDYRDGVYDVLAGLVEKDHIKSSVYKSRYRTILRRAKVQLKKQRSSEETDNTRKLNVYLARYNTLLLPFARKTEVQEHYREVLRIRNRSVLFEQMQILYGAVPIPDSLWNYAASDVRVLMNVYDFLADRDELEHLDPKYLTQDQLARSIVQNANYRNYDTIAFITARETLHKDSEGKAYFFQFKSDKNDDLWKLAYVVVDDQQELTTDDRMNGTGEAFHPETDNVEAIIKDALKIIAVDDRERYVDLKKNRWR
tara:strand:- start:1124 stop:4711 length:3588 start_codon:yes stop_codon:yes gene_type:complete